MRKGPFSTKAKRAALAREVSAIASEVMGRPVELKPEEHFPGELHWREERFETRLGLARWAHLEVDDNGLSVHIAFDDVERAKPECGGMNPYSGKWNHYLWHGDFDRPAWRDTLRNILDKVRPCSC